MATEVDIINRALQTIGTRTTVTSAELANGTSNEAIQANLIWRQYRNNLLRMAPWDCAKNTGNLVYITSAPGTPENTSPATNLWQKGQPAPPWAYEYQYPVDCLRACYIIPANTTGFASGVPITTAVTGGAPAFWWGQPVRFQVAIDQFWMITAASVVAGGTGYAVGDIITLATGAAGEPPIGAPAKLRVATLSGSAVATVTVVNQIQGASTNYGGSYFEKPTNPIAQGETDGSGTGATFNVTWYASKSDQRVILTNQEYATLTYVRLVEDVNVMDEMFQAAWSEVLGAGLAMALTGDKQIANRLIETANIRIRDARQADGNEGLTVNDVTPDFLRVRGISQDGMVSGPYSNYDWGNLWPLF